MSYLNSITINTTENNMLIYVLYGLTDDKIKIVEDK